MLIATQPILVILLILIKTRNVQAWNNWIYLLSSFVFKSPISSKLNYWLMGLISSKYLKSLSLIFKENDSAHVHYVWTFLQKMFIKLGWRTHISFEQCFKSLRQFFIIDLSFFQTRLEFYKTTFFEKINPENNLLKILKKNEIKSKKLWKRGMLIFVIIKC